MRYLISLLALVSVLFLGVCKQGETKPSGNDAGTIDPSSITADNAEEKADQIDKMLDEL